MTEQRNRSPKFPPICTRTLDHLNAAAATNTTTTIPKETPSSSTDQRTVRLAPVLELTAGASVRTKKQLFAPLRKWNLQIMYLSLMILRTVYVELFVS